MANSAQAQPLEGRISSVIGNFLSGDRRWGNLRLIFLGAMAFLLFLASFLVRGGWRDLIAPYAACLLAFMAGARYIQDIYELEKYPHAFLYLLASFFGIDYPHLSVYGGKKVVKADEVNLVDVVGGPGYVYVQPGNAVLFEGRYAPTAIHPNGRQFVPRFETIQPIALEDQYGELTGNTNGTCPVRSI